MKFALGQFMQESHSFTRIPCSWEQFRAGYIYRQAEILAKMGHTRTEMAGAIATAQSEDVEIAPLIACNAVSSGYIEQAVFESLLNELLDSLCQCMPVSGVFIALHGAMVAEHHDDASGVILKAVRELVGSDIPIAASLDLHANITQLMVDMADVLVGYQTCPHVDLYETGMVCMELLVATARGEIAPSCVMRKLPMLLPAEKSVTDNGPFSEIVAQARALEQQNGILSISTFYVQPWLDLADVGSSIVVVAEQNLDLANQTAEQLADAFWSRRFECEAELTPLKSAIKQAIKSATGPVVLADGADAPSGGASGDSTAILHELLSAEKDVTVLINIVDPAAVSLVIQAGVGEVVSLSVGGWSTNLWPPAHIEGVVRLISDGLLRFKGQSYQGVEFQRGRTVVVQIQSIYLQIMERPVYQYDLELYRSVGLDPADADIVVVKSPSGFRPAYEPIASQIIHVDAPGLTSSNLRAFPWQHLQRPFYPLDEFDNWRR